MVHKVSVIRFRASINNDQQEGYHSVVLKAKRLDKETCQKEGIVFGDSYEAHADQVEAKGAIALPHSSDVSPTKVEPPALTDPDAELVAAHLVDDILDSVVHDDTYRETTQGETNEKISNAMSDIGQQALSADSVLSSSTSSLFSSDDCDKQVYHI